MIRGILATTLLLLASTIPARASDLGPPTIYGSVNTCGTGLPASGGTMTCDGMTVAGYYSDGTGTSSVSSVESTCPNCFVVGSVTIGSDFEVEGPTSSSVPLIFTANGFVEGSGVSLAANPGEAEALAEIRDPAGPILFSVAACTPNSGDFCTSVGLPQSFNVGQAFTVSANTLYQIVTLNIVYSIYGAAASASVDPSVTFDPSFNSAGYSLLYSSDATAAPVPLPASAWLLLCGLGGVGAFTRRKLRRAENPV